MISRVVALKSIKKFTPQFSSYKLVPINLLLLIIYGQLTSDKIL